MLATHATLAKARRDATTTFFIPHSSNKNLLFKCVTNASGVTCTYRESTALIIMYPGVSGCSSRHARPLGRTIEVFVASRDDDADYRNAVAQRQVYILFCRTEN